MAVLTQGTDTRRRAPSARRVALVGGLRSARIGDQLGSPDGLEDLEHLSLPGLETVVTPDESGRTAVHDALAVIAEQDPLIDLRVGAEGELAVSLYGEVQKEVLREQLLRDHRVSAEFSRTRTVFIERVDGVGEALAEYGSSGFEAGVGLRVEPAPVGSGIGYRLEVDLGSLLLSFHTAIEETVRAGLQQGLAGWRIPDATVVLTHTAYDSVGSTARRLPQTDATCLVRRPRPRGHHRVRADVEIRPDGTGNRDQRPDAHASRPRCDARRAGGRDDLASARRRRPDRTRPRARSVAARADER